MTRQATDQLYIELDYYYPEEYFVYTAEAASSQSAAFSSTCSAEVIKATAVSLTTTASQSCSAGKIVEFQAEPFSLFNIGVSAFITTSASIDLSSTATMSALGQIVKTTNVTLSTIVSLSLQGARLPGIIQNLSASSTLANTATEYQSYIATSPTPMYALGQALISTTQTKFGTHSLHLPDDQAGAISVSTHTKFNISTTTDFGIAFWYYPTANTVSTYDDIVSHYNTASSIGWAVQRTSTRGIRFFITDGVSSESDQTGSTATTLNAWNWIVVTRSSGTLRIYVNGTQQAINTTHTGGSGTGAKSFRIGDISTNGSAVGYLDGLRINIGNTISATTPTEDTVYSVAGDVALFNWNDSSLGNWWDYSTSELITGAAALTSTASQLTTAEKLTGIIQSLSMTASLTAIGETVSDAAAALSSSCSVTANITKFTNFDSQLTATTTLTAEALDLDLASAGLLSNFTMATTATVTRTTTINVAAVATQTTTATRTRSTDAALTCQGFLVAVGLDLDLASAALTSAFTVTASAIKTARAQSTQTSSFAVSAQPLRTRPFASAVSSSFALNCFETRLKDVFVAGTIGQVYFRNTLGTNDTVNQDDKFIQIGNPNFSYTPVSSFAIAFWASGKGYVWSGVIDDDAQNYNNWIRLTDSGEFVYYFQQTSYNFTWTWSGIDTLTNNHYLLYGQKLYVNGVDQGTPTIVVNGTGSGTMYADEVRALALQAERYNTIFGSPAAPNIAEPGQGYVGALGQYVRWLPNPYGQNAVPDFTQSSQRQKLYNGSYVDIGSDGTATGLVRPFDYIKLENYTDLTNRGAAFSGVSIGNANWRQLGTTFTVSGVPYRYVLAYTATEQDDVGPFASVSTLTVAPISVFITDANLSTQASLTANVTKLVGTIHNFALSTALLADGIRFRSTSAGLVVTGSELTIAVKTGRTLVDMACTATVVADAVKNVQAQASLSATSAVVCQPYDFTKAQAAFNVAAVQISQAVKTARTPVVVSATATLTAVARRTRSSAVSLTATSSLSCAIKRTRGFVSAPSLVTSLFATPYTTWEGQAQLASTATVSANVIAGYIGASTMTASTALACVITKITRITANLSAFDFMLAIGTKVTIDPYYQLVVPRELSVKRIRQETAVLTVDTENRVNTILAENMIIIVPSETSTWHIPYSPQVATRRVQ